MPFNTPSKNVMLDALDESATQITHIGIHTLTDPGTGTNALAGEATGGAPAYARQAVTWGAAAGELKSNTNGMTFDLPAGTYGFYTFYNANTGNTNNYRGYAPFGGAIKGFGAVDAAGVTSNTITSAAHGYSNDFRVMVFNVLTESLPAGLTEGTIYFIVGVTADTFQVSLTLAGAAVDITGIGELFHQRVLPEIFAGQGQIALAIGNVTLDLTGM